MPKKYEFNFLKNEKTKQELSQELGKYIWLIKTSTSQEAPAFRSGSSSLKIGKN